MSAQKETLLNKIRKQFESKYRHYPDILEQLDLELEELSYKSKISKHDLDGIEARLLRAGQSNRGHNKSHSIDSPYRGNLEIPTEGDEDNTQPIQKIQHYRNKSSLQNENTPQNKSSAYKILKGRLSHTPGLTDNSLYYMSPMDIAVLKKGGLIDGENKYSGKKRINATFIEEFERSESPPQRVAKSFMADESIDMDQNNARSGKRLQPIVGVPNLPKTEKMVEREKMIKADVWHKIEDFRVQQFDNKEKQKAVENKKLTQKWLTDLQKQVQDNKMRKDKEKRRDLVAGIKHVESETALQQEHIDKEKRYKEYRSIFEKNSQLANVRARMEQAQLKQYEKNQDSFDIQKEQQRYEMVVGKDRRSQSRDAGPFERQMASREEEKPMKAWIQREEKERMMRKKYVEFLKEKGLYHQSSKNSAQEEHLRNRRKDISIDQANDSILKFMNADHHTEVGRNRMRRNLQNMNDMRQEQTIDKNMKEIIEMEHLKEQKTLWKAKEDQLEIREKLTREAEKLKKLVQKQALDAQIEQARALKRGPITDKEQRINRSILKLID